MTLHVILDNLKDLKKLGNILISRRILFKKIGIMHEKVNFLKSRQAFAFPKKV